MSFVTEATELGHRGHGEKQWSPCSLFRRSVFFVFGLIIDP
jgi:hypothetical protein